MMKNLTLTLVVSMIMIMQPIFAQHSHNGIIRCGTMQHLEWQKQQDPGLEKRMEHGKKYKINEKGDINQIEFQKSTEEVAFIAKKINKPGKRFSVFINVKTENRTERIVASRLSNLKKFRSVINSVSVYRTSLACKQ